MMSQINNNKKFISNNSIYLLVLFITNIISNYLFINYLKFFSDDWSHQVFVRAINWAAHLTSERPLMYILLEVQGYIFQENYLLYHLTSLIMTTTFLFILFYVMKRIANDFNILNEGFPFLVTLIFCILFNKDEIYAWPTTSLANNFAYLVFLCSLFFFLNQKKRIYLIYSLCFFTIGLFTYEVGIALPAFFILYSIISGRNWKQALTFFIPIFFYIFMRVTHIFGFGTDGVNRGIGTYNAGIIINILLFPFAYLAKTTLMILHSIIGWMQMNTVQFLIIICINLLLITLLIWIFNKKENFFIPNEKIKTLLVVSLLIIFTFAAPHIIRGSFALADRHNCLIDIGISMAIGTLFFYKFKCGSLKKPILATFIASCLIFNQGLFYNWVICGDIQDDIYRSLYENKDELKKYDYFIFNSSSFTNHIPNTIDGRNHPIVSELETRIPSTLLKRWIMQNFESSDDIGYYQYYNARALETWSLRAMIDYLVPKENKTIFYTNFSEMPYYIDSKNKSFISYVNRESGMKYLVKKDDVFEINHTFVYQS